MFVKYGIFISIYVGLVLVLGSCSDASHDTESKPAIEQGSPELMLFLQKVEPSSKIILLQLRIKNVGEYRLVLPRPNENSLKQYVLWGGYDLSIWNQDEQGFIFGASRPPGVSKNELLKLNPGEEFSMTINIADAKHWIKYPSKDTKGDYLELVNTHGEFSVKAHLISHDETIPTDLRKMVWKGKKESNTITFTIDHGQNPQEGQHVSQP